MSPAWRITERRRPPGSQPQDGLATGVALTLRTRDHTSVEEGPTAGDKLPPDRETQVHQGAMLTAASAWHHDPPDRGPCPVELRASRWPGSGRTARQVLVGPRRRAAARSTGRTCVPTWRRCCVTWTRGPG